MDSYPRLERLAELFAGLAHRIDHAERHIGNRERVPGMFFRDSARHHIGVTDRFDLFQVEPLYQRIESREQSVQEINDAGWRTLACKGREIHQISEQDGRIREAIGNRDVSLSDAAYDRFRQDIEQQSLGLTLLDPQLVNECQFAIT